MRGEEENFARHLGVTIRASVMNPQGNGAPDPSVLLNDWALHLHNGPISAFQYSRTYDTYIGVNQESDSDWYAIDFGRPTTFNCIEMTTGFAYPDGGWWTSLSVEFHRTEIQKEAQNDNGWHAVESLSITPSYNFADSKDARRPFESYMLMFPPVTARAVRIIGAPGGKARFTSLSRIGVYYHDLTRWNASDLPDPPIPYVFRLISPQSIWDLSQNLLTITGLMVHFPLYEMYLDAHRMDAFIQRIERNYYGDTPDLSVLVSRKLGIREFARMYAPMQPEFTQNLRTEPYVQTRWHSKLYSAVAPIVVGDQILGEMMTSDVLIHAQHDIDWHRHMADQLGIAWDEYRMSMECTPHMSMEQIEAVAGLLGMIANTIAQLAHKTIMLQDKYENWRTLSHKELVRHAISYMQNNLESPIGVSDVAKVVALSVPHFNRLFKEHTGSSPGEFMMNLKFERAKDYLSHTRMSVLEVCSLLGYTPSYFSRMFKSRLGCTPTEFQQRQRNRTG
jgi:AraC-like DNA-binding protein